MSHIKTWSKVCLMLTIASLSFSNIGVNAQMMEEPYDPVISTTMLEGGFSDVDANNPFKEYIMEMKGAGISTGYGDGSFKPKNNLSRGEMAKFVKKAIFGTDYSNLTCGNFSDVDTANTFYTDITTLKCEGIVNGMIDSNTKATVFLPQNMVTRGETMKFIVNSIKKKKPNLVIVPVNNFDLKDVVGTTFENEIKTGFSLKLTSGYEDKTFKPNNRVSREEVSKFIILARKHSMPTALEALKASPDHKSLVKALEVAGLSAALDFTPLTDKETLAIFAPTDAAFAKLDQTMLNSLLTDPTKKETLATLLKYHVGQERDNQAPVMRNMDTKYELDLVTLSGKKLVIKGTTTSANLQVMDENGTLANSPTSSEADTDSLFIPIDSVLMPKDGWDYNMDGKVSCEDFGTLVTNAEILKANPQLPMTDGQACVDFRLPAAM